MKTRTFFLCLFLMLAVGGLARANETAASLFPLEKGSYWVYRGTVKWIPEGAGRKVRSKSITWRMRVREVIESPGYRIAIVTGFPGDLAWYDEGMTPRWSVLVEDDRRVYLGDYETKGEAAEAAEAVRTGGKKSLRNLDCIIEFPLAKGKKYGIQGRRRPDTGYIWHVEEAEEGVSLEVKGFDAQPSATKYRLVNGTNPDHIIMEFVPGLGITRYSYQNHGTAAFEDMRLIEYGRSR